MAKSYDVALLDEILQPCNDPELSASERRAFYDMRAALRAGDQDALTLKQRTWAVEVQRRLAPIDTTKLQPLSGRVPTMPVLAGPLPKKPPGSS